MSLHLNYVVYSNYSSDFGAMYLSASLLLRAGVEFLETLDDTVAFFKLALCLAIRYDHPLPLRREEPKPVE